MAREGIASPCGEKYMKYVKMVFLETGFTMHVDTFD